MGNKSRTKLARLRVFPSRWKLMTTLALVALLSVTAQLHSLAEGDPEAPLKDFDYGFTIKDLEGNRIAMETFRGKVIFLNVWATWCGPCRMEMPGIQALYEKVDKEKIVFIMLSIDRDEDKNRIVRYMRDKKFTFNAYQPSGSLTEQLTIPSIPTTFIISPDGKIAKKEVGAQDYNTASFEKYLAKLAE